MKKTAFTYFLLLLSVCPAYPADWYVGATSAGSNNGTSWANQWAYTAITWASVSAGDTLYIDGGASGITYTGQLAFGKSGTSGSPITFRPGSASPSPSGHAGYVKFSRTASHVINMESYIWVSIDGETTVGAGTRNMGVEDSGATNSYPLYSNGSTGITIRYLNFINNAPEAAGGDYGIRLVGTASEIAYCYFMDSSELSIYYANVGNECATYGTGLSIHHNSINADNAACQDAIRAGGCVDIYANTVDWKSTISNHVDGLQIASDNIRYVRIFNNIIKNVPNWSIAIAPLGDGDSAAYVKIYNNLIDETYEEYTAPKGIRLYVEEGSFSDVSIFNNTLINSYYEGIYVKSAGGTAIDAIDIRNNLLINSAYIHFDATLTATNITIDYNYLYSATASYMNIDLNGTTYSCSGGEYSGINANGGCGSMPSFVNFDGANYALAADDTAAKNSGVDLSAAADMDAAWPADIIGNTRTGAWDIGAYEYQAPPSGKFIPANIGTGRIGATPKSGGSGLGITVY